MVSCGGGDDAPEPVEAITEEEYNLRQVCEIFGINRNDYDRISGRGIDGVNVFAFHNKNNNILAQFNSSVDGHSVALSKYSTQTIQIS